MICLNLPSDYELRLDRIARHENIDASEVIRKAIEFYFNFYKETAKSDNYEALMNRLSYAEAGRSFSRDELNER